MSCKIRHLYRFKDFRLDLDQRVLLRDGKPLPVTPKAFHLLEILVENHGRIVEKEKLIAEIWADSFVEEGNLPFNVRALRKVLGDDAGNPTFIETVPRRGYRFIAPVETEKVEPLNQPPVVAEAQSKNFHFFDENLSDEASSEFKNAPASDVKKLTTQHYLLWSSVSAFLILGLASALWWYGAKKPAAQTGQMKIERLTSNGKAKLAAVSPDGRFIAYVMDDEGRQSLWLRSIAGAGGSDREILPPSENVSLGGITFSPDGNYIFYAANKTLYQLPILGGLSKKILENSGAGTITFSPDRSQLAFIRHSPENEASLIVANADGTNQRAVAASKSPDLFLTSAAWSPDGKTIAVTMRSVDAAYKAAAVRIADGVVSVIPSQKWNTISQIAWRPDGDGLFVVGADGRSSISAPIWELSYPDSATRNITNDLNSYEGVSLTADGREIIAVRVEQVVHIWGMSDEETGKARQLTYGVDGYDGIFGLGWRGEEEIIYETVLRDGKGEVWTVAPDGRSYKQITSEAGSTGESPDGKYLVFQSGDDKDKNPGLFRFDLNSGEKKRLTTGLDVWATFSLDGKWVIFTRWAAQVALWKVSIDGGEAVKLTDVYGAPLAPAVSPDGKIIAFYWRNEKRGQPSEIALISFDGGEIIKTFNVSFGYSQGAGKPALQWTADGQAVNYISHRDGVSNIWRQPIDGSPPVPATDFTEQRIFNFAYSPNGRQLALSRGTFDRDVVRINNFK